MSKVDYEAIWYELDFGDEVRLTSFLDDLDEAENRQYREITETFIQDLIKTDSQTALKLDEAINMISRTARKHGIAAGRALSRFHFRDPGAVAELQAMRKKLAAIYSL
jgi:hypothetical protein